MRFTMFLIDSLAKVLNRVENLLNITEKSALEFEQYRDKKALSLNIKDRAIALFSVSNLDIDDIDSLLYIHSYLYKDEITSFKDNFYKSPLYTEIKDSYIYDFDSIVLRYIKLLKAKPFNLHNSVTINLYLNLCLKSKLKCLIDFSKIDRDVFEDIIEYAIASDNLIELKEIFKENFVYTLNDSYYIKCLYY